MNYLAKLYKLTIINHSKAIFLLLLLNSFFFGYHAFKFQLDASPDSLILENDKDLDYYRFIKARYGSDDYLIITYSPINGDLFDDASLIDLQSLKNDLSNINNVNSVTTILDVPLINSPKISFSDLPNGIRRIEDGNVNKNMAKSELTSSPLYKNSLISEDGTTTTLLVKFERDQHYYVLLDNRDELRQREIEESLSEDGKIELELSEKIFDAYRAKSLDLQSQNISDIRQIMARYVDKYDLYLGGVPMIVSDSISFINSDIKTFGIAVLCFIIITLLIIFRSIKWVFAPLLICFVVILIMLGFLGLSSWPVTLVSSNFISLLLIITLSITIHIIVRYRELCILKPELKSKELAAMAVQKMATPCFYTAITTIIAFSSLSVSNIRPIIDFGYMMVIGIVISFACSFILLPHLIPKKEDIVINKRQGNFSDIFTKFFSNLVCKNASLIFSIFTILIIFGIWGMFKLSVENSFINYYKESTSINQGMRLIDNKLGGTTPLDIVIDKPKEEFGDDDFEDDLSDFFMVDNDKECSFSGGYWFNSFSLHTISKIHNYLSQLPEIGNVMSLNTSAQLLKSLNKGKPIDSFSLEIACNKLSMEEKEILFNPYISQDGNQIHFDIRIFESSDSLKRDQLIKEIRNHLIEKIGLQEEQVHINGMLVLYNNILQSLFKSQILTIGFVFFVILLMFILLFRNLKIALIAIIPNIIVAILALGIMGWANIPLDIMTITIAAISIGIAVDDTIHYIHRFQEEFKKDGNYKLAIARSHQTIGKAMYYTTITIAFGFSILIFSNFVPTIYFGILTALSMIFALLSDFMLLPLLLLKLKPLSKVK